MLEFNEAILSRIEEIQAFANESDSEPLTQLSTLQALEFMVYVAYDGTNSDAIMGTLLVHPEIFKLALLGLNTSNNLGLNTQPTETKSE